MTDREIMQQAWAKEKTKNPHTAYNSWFRGYEAALAQPEAHTTLHDVCQEVLRLEKINAGLLEALKELLRVEAISDDGEIILEVARHNARAAIAKAEEQA